MWLLFEPIRRAQVLDGAFSKGDRCLGETNSAYCRRSSTSLAVRPAISPMERRMSSLSLGSSHRSAMRLASASSARMFSSPSGPPWGSASQAWKIQYKYSFAHHITEALSWISEALSWISMKADEAGLGLRIRQMHSAIHLGEHGFTCCCNSIWPEQRPASWQWPAWHWLAPPTYELHRPPFQITNPSPVSTGLRAACTPGSVLGPCHVKKTQ